MCVYNIPMSARTKLQNFLNKHKFKKQMQTGGGDKQVDSTDNNKKIMNVKQAVSLLNEVYKE